MRITVQYEEGGPTHSYDTGDVEKFIEGVLGGVKHGMSVWVDGVERMFSEPAAVEEKTVKKAAKTHKEA